MPLFIFYPIQFRIDLSVCLSSLPTMRDFWWSPLKWPGRAVTGSLNPHCPVAWESTSPKFRTVPATFSTRYFLTVFEGQLQTRPCFPLDKIRLVCVKVPLLRFQAFLFLVFFTALVVFPPALPSLTTAVFNPRSSPKLEREETMTLRIRERLLGSVTSRFHFEHPTQCPEGHRQISWVSSENNVHCWLCDKAYPISDCFVSHDEIPPPATN